MLQRLTPSAPPKQEVNMMQRVGRALVPALRANNIHNATQPWTTKSPQKLQKGWWRRAVRCQ